MFSKIDIEKIAALASLELSEEEKTLFASQFQGILAYFKIIDSAPPPPPPSTTPTSPVALREDKAVDSGISPAAFSPYLEEGHFKVPKTID